MLRKVSRGIQELVRMELGFSWKNATYVKATGDDWEPVVVGRLMPTDPALVLRPGFAFYADGRLPIPQKVAFFLTAQHEIIEFGEGGVGGTG